MTAATRHLVDTGTFILHFRKNLKAVTDGLVDRVGKVGVRPCLLDRQRIKGGHRESDLIRFEEELEDAGHRAAVGYMPRGVLREIGGVD